MPTYVYEVILPDGEEGQVFEVVQKMSDAALTKHPTTGQPVRRVIQTPNVATRYTSSHDKKRLSQSNLESNGFTRYEKVGDGKYEKTAGVGPKQIKK